MLNREVNNVGTLTGADYNGFPVSQQGSSFWDRVTSSGYVGPKPRPLQPHSFSYEVCQIAKTYSFREEHLFKGVPIGVRNLSGPGLDAITPFSWSMPGVNTSSMYDELLERLNARVRGDLDLSVDLAESHQVKSMLNLFANANQLAKTVKRKFGVLKLAGDAYLQFVYGWKPLASSIYGVATELLERAHTAPFRDISSRVTRKSGDGLVLSVLNWDHNAVTNVATGSYDMKGRMSLHLGSQTGVQSLSRFTSLNPLSIAWELTPYSFVADWAFDIGSYLRNTETGLINSDSFISGFWSQSERFDSSLDSHSIAETDLGNGHAFVGETTHKGYVHFRRYSRTVMPGYPFPSFPSIQVKMGASRLLSAASLLAQHLR